MIHTLAFSEPISVQRLVIHKEAGTVVIQLREEVPLAAGWWRFDDSDLSFSYDAPLVLGSPTT